MLNEQVRFFDLDGRLGVLQTHPNSYLLIKLMKGGITMKWGLKSLRSRRKERELKMYVEMKIMEARIQRLLDTLDRRERKHAT